VDEPEDEDEALNRFALNKYRIDVPLNGEKINLCEVEYLKMASTLHPRLKDTMIAACSGSSSNRKHTVFFLFLYV
jgi:hypothetical protein